MRLKRIFIDEIVDGQEGVKVLKHIKVLRAGKIQNFSPKIIERFIAEGLMVINGKEIVLNTVPPLKYRVVRGPGYYCCHCNAAVGDSSAAKEHILSAHAGEASPDPFNPAGYRKDNFYHCERVI